LRKEEEMDRQDVEKKVREVLADQLARDVDEVTLEARFEEDLDADSLDLVEAVLALEEELGVDIPEEEMEGVTTVGQAVDLVMTKKGAGVS
jgi:acyl carrier protein